jgi:hypothetical protein
MEVGCLHSPQIQSYIYSQCDLTLAGCSLIDSATYKVTFVGTSEDRRCQGKKGYDALKSQAFHSLLIVFRFANYL